MATRIVFENGDWCPKVWCDHCELEIDQAGWGLYAWRKVPDGTPTKIYHVHKRGCVDAFQGARGGRREWSDMDIRYLPIYLAKNMGMDREELRSAYEGARDLSGV